MDFLKLSKSEVSKLIESGIVIETKRPFEDGTAIFYSLNDELKKSLYTYLKKYVFNHVLIDYQIAVKELNTKFYLVFSDIKSKTEYLKKTLESLSQNIDYTLLDLQSNDEIWQYMLFDYITDDEALEFISSGQINSIHNNDLIKEWIEIAVSQRLITHIKGAINKNDSYKTKLSFHWQGSAIELTNLYSKMMASKLIAQDTAEADFKAIFEAKPLDAIKPIRWIETKVLLAYFIHQLSISNSKISASDNHWKIAESCFENASNLKQISDGCQNNKTGRPKNHHLIDELF